MNYYFFGLEKQFKMQNTIIFSFFQHITKHIKELYDIEYSGYDDGDISLLHPKVVRYQYLLIKSRTGDPYEKLTPNDFLVGILMKIPKQEKEQCLWRNIDPGIKRKENLISARTGVKRNPGEKRDFTKSVTFKELNTKTFILNDSYKYQLYFNKE